MFQLGEGVEGARSRRVTVQLLAACHLSRHLIDPFFSHTPSLDEET